MIVATYLLRQSITLYKNLGGLEQNLGGLEPLSPIASAATAAHTVTAVNFQRNVFAGGRNVTPIVVAAARGVNLSVG